MGKNPVLLFIISIGIFVVSFLGCQTTDLHLSGDWTVTALDINNNVYSINQTSVYLKNIQFHGDMVYFTYGNEWHSFAFGLDNNFTYSLDQTQNTITLKDNNNVEHTILYKWDGETLVLQNWSSSLVNVIGGGSPISYIKLHKK